MATDLDKVTSLQALADSTGLIYDRAVYPEKVIGQAWLISRGRVVTLASAVSNYYDAPWALIIKFPHPNLTYAVRTVTLHPDFNKREARDYYLAAARGGMPPPAFENDIATLALDTEVTVPEPERVAELNRALSLPFEISANDMSGAMRGGELLNILQSALSTGRSGLLTMVDQRNVPYARISVRQARVVRAQFENLFNEIAVCELIWRKQAGNFAFQPVDNHRWPPDVPEIATPTDQIIAEAMRRADELPRVIDMLGGPEVRFERITKLADFSQINPAERWVAERVWEVIDGYLPLSKIAERAGTDTYSAIKMMWDFATMGLINVNQNPTFHNSGQPGPLLLPAQDVELNTWDQLTAMYLDPISGGPAIQTGNFFGSAHVLQNKSLLHTAPVPATVYPAAVFKDGKLVGIHTGPANVRGQNMPPVTLQRMIWIGALNDIGTKRLRTAEAAAEEDMMEGDLPSEDPQATSQRLQTLRNRPMSTLEGSTKSGKPGASKPGQPVVELPEEETGPLAKVSKKALLVPSALMFVSGALMLAMSFMMPHGGGPQTAQKGPETTTETATATAAPAPLPANPEIGDPKAQAMATSWAQMSGTPPPTYKFTDTMKLTDPRESFGLRSEGKNTEIVFIRWPNAAPLNDLTLAPKLVGGFFKLYPMDKTVWSGNTAHTQWMACSMGSYELGIKGTIFVMGTMRSTDPNGCVLWAARGAQENTSVPDIEYPPKVVEQMVVAKLAQPRGGAGNDATGTAEVKLATPEQLTDYRKKLASLIKQNYKMPKAGEDADTSVGIAFTIDTTGAVSNLQIKPNPDDEFNKAIQRAFDASKPLPPAPQTKSGKYELLILANGTDITVDEQ